MICHVKGTVLAATERSCLLATPGGVGYEVFLPTPALAHLPEPGSEARFFTVQVIREDANELFGFETLEERGLFRILTSVSNLGPRKALAILSRFSPEELREVVASGDLTALTSVSGIGKKSGQQIMVELKFKLDDGRPSVPRSKAKAVGGVFDDVLVGLRNLGYDDQEGAAVARRVLEAEPDLDAAGALRACLKAMAAAKAG